MFYIDKIGVTLSLCTHGWANNEKTRVSSIANEIVVIYEKLTDYKLHVVSKMRE